MAKAAILLQLDAVWVVLFVFGRVIIPLLAVAASERDADTHGVPPVCSLRTYPFVAGKQKKPSRAGHNSLTYAHGACQDKKEERS
jgi:hypothetical protein